MTDFLTMFEYLTKLHYEQALIHTEHNRFEDAVKALIKCLELDKDNIEAWNLLGVCFCIQGKFKKAVKVFGQSLAVSDEKNIAGKYLQGAEERAHSVEKFCTEVEELFENKKYFKAVKTVNAYLEDVENHNPAILRYCAKVYKAVWNKKKALELELEAISMDIK